MNSQPAPNNINIILKVPRHGSNTEQNQFKRKDDSLGRRMLLITNIP